MNPQTPNQTPFFGQKVSKQGVNVTQATDNQLVLKDDYSTRTYYDGTGIPRIILGLLPDGNYGLVISKPGFDVTQQFN